MTRSNRFFAQTRRCTSGCIEWCAYRLPSGYGLFTWTTGRRILSHRAAWELAKGPIPEGRFVLHRCDNPACVNVRHLFLGTHTVNMRDMIAKGRHNYGERRYNAKLTDRTVRLIRRSSASSGALAAKLGCSAKAVRLARSGRTWRHVHV